MHKFYRYKDKYAIIVWLFTIVNITIFFLSLIDNRVVDIMSLFFAILFPAIYFQLRHNTLKITDNEISIIYINNTYDKKEHPREVILVEDIRNIIISKNEIFICTSKDTHIKKHNMEPKDFNEIKKYFFVLSESLANNKKDLQLTDMLNAKNEFRCNVCNGMINDIYKSCPFCGNDDLLK